METKLSEVKTVTVRKPHFIAEGNGNIETFHAQIEAFCKKAKVVEKHISIQMMPTGQSKINLPTIGQQVQLQMQAILMCFMVYEDQQLELEKSENDIRTKPVKLITL